MIKLECICELCGVEFETGNKSHQKYCSKKCRLIISNKRIPYRRIVEEKLGRSLEKGEFVHHIDMEDSNNDPDNLWVFSNAKEHGLAHGSINKLIKKLLAKNIIYFDEEKGKYFLV